MISAQRLSFNHGIEYLVRNTYIRYIDDKSDTSGRLSTSPYSKIKTYRNHIVSRMLCEVLQSCHICSTPFNEPHPVTTPSLAHPITSLIGPGLHILPFLLFNLIFYFPTPQPLTVHLTRTLWRIVLRRVPLHPILPSYTYDGIDVWTVSCKSICVRHQR